MSSRLIASFFGIGYTPGGSPGTIGAAAAAVLGTGLMLVPFALPIGVALACLAGFVCIPRAVTDRDLDPGWVVIDEVAGMWIAMLALPAVTWHGPLVAFAIFRLLDIWKPGPVGWADRRHGATGIMLDDLIAGTCTAAILWGAQVLTPGVFG